MSDPSFEPDMMASRARLREAMQRADARVDRLVCKSDGSTRVTAAGAEAVLEPDGSVWLRVPDGHAIVINLDGIHVREASA